MTDLTRLKAADLADKIRSREVSSEEVTRSHLNRIDEINGRTQAFLHVDADGALTTARQVDSELAQGRSLPALAGVPGALKDSIVTRDVPTTCASRMLEDWLPPYDATVTDRLRAAGMPVLGKTNLDEFGMGSSTENSAFGPSHNPWDLERVPGGSGGGSSAALASFATGWAIGTDTGGSIRQPAANTGTVGVKPTYGSVSRYGVVALSSSLDHVGPCTRTVLDAALLHEIVAGHDPLDSTSIEGAVPPVVSAAREGARGDLTGVRIGVVRELAEENHQAGVRESFEGAVAQLRELGAEVVPVSCPHITHALAAYYLIAPSECSSNLARLDAMRFGLRVGDDGEHGAEEVMARSREAGFGPEVKRRTMLGAYALSAGYADSYYRSAQKVRTLISRDFTAAFDQVDVLVSPTTPTTAFRIGERVDDPAAMHLSDLCTVPANMAGIPAMSLPSGLSDTDRLPVGLQLMAPVLADERLYRVGAAYEAARGELFDAVSETTRTSPEVVT